MNISKKSGHYRCVDRLEFLVGYPSDSLCRYFWQAFFAINIHIMLPVGLVLFPMAVILDVCVLPFNNPVGLFQVLCDLYIIAAAGMGGLVWVVMTFVAVIGVSAGLGWCLGELHKCGVHKGWITEAAFVVEKPPSIIGEYIKAKVDKVCPLITYTEG